MVAAKRLWVKISKADFEKGIDLASGSENQQSLRAFFHALSSLRSFFDLLDRSGAFKCGIFHLYGRFLVHTHRRSLEYFGYCRK